MNRYLTLGVLCTMFTLPLAAQLDHREEAHERREAVRRYEDRIHHDSHEWNSREDEAYKRYLESRREHYRDFQKANRRQQEAYWAWRHDHPDARR